MSRNLYIVCSSYPFVRPLISRNVLIGDIPELYTLTVLRELDLSFNRFVRLPPPSISNLNALVKLVRQNSRIELKCNGERRVSYDGTHAILHNSSD
jgi:Leucine-rich repeat (LRR) protein